MACQFLAVLQITSSFSSMIICDKHIFTLIVFKQAKNFLARMYFSHLS
jgi:hypothetical protein